MAVRIRLPLESLVQNLDLGGYKVEAVHQITGAPGRDVDIFLQNRLTLKWDTCTKTIWAEGPSSRACRNIEAFLHAVCEGDWLERMEAIQRRRLMLYVRKTGSKAAQQFSQQRKVIGAKVAEHSKIVAAKVAAQSKIVSAKMAAQSRTLPGRIAAQSKVLAAHSKVLAAKTAAETKAVSALVANRSQALLTRAATQGSAMVAKTAHAIRTGRQVVGEKAEGDGADREARLTTDVGRQAQRLVRRVEVRTRALSIFLSRKAMNTRQQLAHFILTRAPRYARMLDPRALPPGAP